MGIIFNLFLAYDHRFGMLPRMIKALRASGKPEDLKEANTIQAQLDDSKKNPPKNAQEVAARTLANVAQTGRDLRIDGRHEDADRLEKIVEHAKANMLSTKKD